MKKISIMLTSLILTLTFTLFCFAKPVTLDDVMTVGEVHLKAENQYQMDNGELGIQSILNVREIKENGETLAYIIDLIPEGCMIVSSDTDISPVIAFSSKGSFLMEDTPDNVFLHLIKLDMEKRLEALPMTSDKLKKDNNLLWDNYITQNETLIQKLSSGVVSGPWLKTTWHQSDPYNKYCPIDPSTSIRSPVGCVATAMAQILYYKKSPNSMIFAISDGYTSRIGTTQQVKIFDDWLSRSFPSRDTLNGLLTNIKYDENNINTNEIAALCFACGIAVKMQYGSSGSGANHDPKAYNRFGYSASLIMGNDISFYSILKDNMINAQPAQIGLSDHSIVADGFRDNWDGVSGEFYHLNFGWAKDSPDLIPECWYTLPSGMPAGYNAISDSLLNIRLTDCLQANSLSVTSYVITGSKVQCSVNAVDLTGHNPLIYQWTAKDNSGPAGSFSSTNTASTEWTPPENYTNSRASYIITVKVTCSIGKSETLSSLVTVFPIADSYEPDNDSTTAKEQQLNTKSSIRNTMNMTNIDYDWIKFTLTSPSDVIIETSGPSGNTTMYLYRDPTQLSIANNDNINNPYNLFSRISYPALSAGTYYIKIRTYGSTYDDDITEYYVEISTHDVAISSISGTPNPVVPGGIVQCNVTATDKPTTLSHTISYQWTAKDASGNPAGSFSPNSITQNPTWTAPSNNTKSVVIYTITATATCSGGKSDSQYFQQRVSPNIDTYETDNTSATAKEQPLNSKYYHNIVPLADADWIKFTLSNSLNVVIETNGPKKDTVVTYDTVIYLYKDPTLPYIATNDDWGGNGLYSRISKTLDAGTYYVRIIGYNNNRLVPEYYLNISTHVIINSNPSGTPNTVNSGGIVQCNTKATCLLGDSINYSWVAKDGSGVSAGSFSPNSYTQNPVWTAPANNTSNVVYYTLTMTATCTGDSTANVRSYQQGVALPIQIQISAKTTPPASANVWNIVGPSVITLDKSIVNNFGAASFGTTWIAWRWNPTSAKWEVPAAVGSNPVTLDHFDAGTSWFYALDGDGFVTNKNVNGTPVNTAASFSVPLKAGWNLICNPFDFSVAWSDSSIKIKYGEWEGTPTEAAAYVDNRAIWYNPETRAYVTRRSNEAIPYGMLKTRGQWLYSLVDGASVVFPPVAYTEPSPAPPIAPLDDSSLWKVELTLRSSKGNDTVEAIADNKQVSLRDIKPPSLPISTSSISLIRDDNELSSDRQKESNEMIWTFEVSASEESSLGWKLIGIPDDYRLTLEDETGKQIDIRQMRILPIDKVEKKSYILKATRVLAPKVTRLLTNYPNPFNPDTWIPYELSEGSEVVIKIYTSAGNLVRTLNLGRKEVGYYTTQSKSAHWDGNNEYGERVSSGIYFYSIKTAEYTSTRKMVIVK